MKSGRENQQLLVALSPASKAGELLPFPQYQSAESGSSQPARDRQSHLHSQVSLRLAAGRERPKQRPAFTAEEMRHSFAIESLGKPARFKSQPYLYTCVRCKWMFRINDLPGSIISLDGLGRQLPEPENHKRAVTFAGGPCPAFSEIHRFATQPIETFGFAHYFWRFVDLLLRPITGGKRGRHDRKLHSTAFIAPYDLLS